MIGVNTAKKHHIAPIFCLGYTRILVIIEAVVAPANKIPLFKVGIPRSDTKITVIIYINHDT